MNKHDDKFMKDVLRLMDAPMEQARACGEWLKALQNAKTQEERDRANAAYDKTSGEIWKGLIKK